MRTLEWQDLTGNSKRDILGLAREAFMQTMNISLPDPMKHFVEEQVNAGGYSSASEYVRELVRADQKRKAKEALELVLLDALKSEPETVTPEWWAKLREEIRGEAKQVPVPGR
jgi:antitoxin ParD1/3/4